MGVTRREFITRTASAVALAVLSPMRTMASPGTELGRKAERGNAEFIKSHNVSVKSEVVGVGGEKFTVMVFHKEGTSTQRFFVPHDNEIAAFDTALRFVGEQGGTLVTFDSGGGRNLKTEGGRSVAQDPNRMFVQTSNYWSLAKHVFDLVNENGKPVITLHNNGPIGSFVNSLNNPAREGLTLSLVNKETRRDIVWIAGKERLTDSPDNAEYMRALNGQGVNCLYEHVDEARRSDGSLSQYCARNGIPYFNIEVGFQGFSEAHIIQARERQIVILRTLMGILQKSA